MSTTSETGVRANLEKLEMEFTRVLNAPRELVWDAYTKPEHIEKWWGPRKYQTIVLELDLRPGGTWRFVNRAEDGREHPFRGVFKEVVKPERLVGTFVYDVEGARDDEMVDIATFEDLGGKTRLTTRSVFPSLESLQGALNSGMESAWIESIDRLEEFVTGK